MIYQNAITLLILFQSLKKNKTLTYTLYRNMQWAGFDQSAYFCLSAKHSHWVLCGGEVI